MEKCNFEIKVGSKTFEIENVGIDNSYDSFHKSLTAKMESDVNFNEVITKVLNAPTSSPNINVTPNRSVGLHSPADLLRSLKSVEINWAFKKLKLGNINEKRIVVGYADEEIPSGYIEDQLFMNLAYDFDDSNKIITLFELALKETFGDEYETYSKKMRTSERDQIIKQVLGDNYERLGSTILKAYYGLNDKPLDALNDNILINPEKLTPAEVLLNFSNLSEDEHYTPYRFGSIYDLTQGDLIGIKIPNSENYAYELFVSFTKYNDSFKVRTLKDGKLFTRTFAYPNIRYKKYTSSETIAPFTRPIERIITNVKRKYKAGNKLRSDDIYKLIKLGLIQVIDPITKDWYNPIAIEGQRIKLSGNKVINIEDVNLMNIILPVTLHDLTDVVKTSHVKIGDIAQISYETTKTKTVFVIGISQTGISYVDAAGHVEFAKFDKIKGISVYLFPEDKISKNDEVEVLKSLENLVTEDTFRNTKYSVSDGYEEMSLFPGNFLVQGQLIYKVLHTSANKIRVIGTDEKIFEISKRNLSGFKVVGHLELNSTFATQNIWKNRPRIGDAKLNKSENIEAKIYQNPKNKFLKAYAVNDKNVDKDLVDITSQYRDYLRVKYKNDKFGKKMYFYKNGNYYVKNNANTVFFKNDKSKTDLYKYLVPGSFLQLDFDPINTYIVERMTDKGIVASLYKFSSEENPNVSNEDLKYIKKHTIIVPKDMNNVNGFFIPNWASSKIGEINSLMFSQNEEDATKFSYQLPLNDNDSPELIYNMSKVISEKFGVKVHIIGNKDLKNFPELQGQVKVRAFVSNGEIYVNIDQASIEEPLHELLHLVLGTMKAMNPTEYYGIISSIQGHPLYDTISETYNEVNADVLEEVFIRLLTKTFRNSIDVKGIFTEVHFNQALKAAIGELMNLKGDLSEENSMDLLNDSVKNLMLNFESSLIENREGLIDTLESITMIQVSTLLRNLLKNKNLTQIC